MANKNTQRWRRLNPAQTGASLVISQNLRRNMELAIVGGRTIYRPIEPGMTFFPARTPALNQVRRHWGRDDKQGNKPPANTSAQKPVNTKAPADTQQAA